ncbi:MAG: DNA-packaging protein, partial [Bradyrhizobium sp.]|nr:DNA-packaging protein [Bradyrhizobium sp.]
LTKIVAKYEGTRLGRQELMAEILEDNPGALWRRDDIDRTRVVAAPELRRIVVAIDPAAKSVEGSDDTGIVVAGVADIEESTHAFVLDDATMSLAKPAEWAREAVRLYRARKADRIIAEGNNGGEMVESTIKAQDGNVPVTIVTATRGKEIRAEPVSALYEQGRIHHVGNFAKLEDELCEWDPADKTAASPNRLDALVWAITALMLENDGTGILDFYRQQANRAKQTNAANPR